MKVDCRLHHSNNITYAVLVWAAFALVMTTMFACSSSAIDRDLHWETLRPIPDKEGFAGSFAGVHNGALIVAGGANFPDKRPWEGGVKRWYDSIFVLESPAGRWKSGFKLPKPLGYGVSISHSDGLICIGGSDSKGHSADVFSLSWTNEEIRTKALPSLPTACANFCGVLIDETIYVAGGIEKPDSTNALKTFWALDLNDLRGGWKTLDAWPGPGRMLASAGVNGGDFYLFGGAAMKAAADGKPVREWLRDAYVFTPGKGWKRIADLPHSVVAAPSPVPDLDGSRLLLLGGDDGAQVNAAPTEHRGFPHETLAYNIEHNEWREFGRLPFGLVTTTAVRWNGNIVIPGGEARPGVRSTEVWSGAIVNRKRN